LSHDGGILIENESTVKPANSTPLNSTKPVKSNMSFGTRIAFPYDSVPLNNTSLQTSPLFLRSESYVLFAGFTVEPIAARFIATKCLNGETSFFCDEQAFRRVKFEGLPSLPSRGSSSATSSSYRPTSRNSHDRNTPTPDLIASMNTNTDAIDRLLPAWERLLTLLGTVGQNWIVLGLLHIECICLM
jgi:hypothetical protein